MKNQESNLSGKGLMKISVWLILKITLAVLIVAAFLDALTGIMIHYVSPHLEKILPFSAYTFIATFAFIEIGTLLILFVKPKRRNNRLNSNLSLSA